MQEETKKIEGFLAVSYGVLWGYYKEKGSLVNKVLWGYYKEKGSLVAHSC
jgi:hypothetical protein